MIDATRLWQMFDYDPATGALRWKHRADQAAAWNGKMPGRRAGTYVNGYLSIRIDGIRYSAHRLAWIMMYGPIPNGLEIDHVDMDGTNNRLANLRLATHAQNCANTIRKSASGIKGVTWREDKGKWGARITINRKSINLGYFATAEEAHMTYLARAQAQHGEFARGTR